MKYLIVLEVSLRLLFCRSTTHCIFNPLIEALLLLFLGLCSSTT